MTAPEALYDHCRVQGGADQAPRSVGGGVLSRIHVSPASTMQETPLGADMTIVQLPESDTKISMSMPEWLRPAVWRPS